MLCCAHDKALQGIAREQQDRKAVKSHDVCGVPAAVGPTCAVGRSRYENQLAQHSLSQEYEVLLSYNTIKNSTLSLGAYIGHRWLSGRCIFGVLD
jgi:hypothetical protein